jgi:hypothetical protein
MFRNSFSIYRSFIYKLLKILYLGIYCITKQNFVCLLVMVVLQVCSLTLEWASLLIFMKY